MSVLKRLPAHALRLGLLLLLVAALLVSVLRFVQPLANELRGGLSQVLSERLGYDVSISALRLGSTGLEPRVTLEGVRLTKARDHEAALSLRAVELDLALLASIRAGAPRFDAFTLVGAHLVVERAADGRLRVVGLGGLQGDDPRALELFLGQGQLNLVDSDVIYIDRARGGRLARLTGLRLSVRNEGTHHVLRLEARLVPPNPVSTARTASAPADPSLDGQGNRLRLDVELEGPPADPWSWSGRLYGRLAAGNVGLLGPVALAEDLRLDTGAVRLELWQRIDRGRLDHATARLEVEDLQFSLPDGVRSSAMAGGDVPPRLDHVSALARLSPAGQGWRLEVEDLGARLGRIRLDRVDADLRLGRQGDLMGLGLAMERLSVGDLAELLRVSPWSLPDGVRGLLERDPRGDLRAIRLAARKASAGDRGPARWSFSATASDLALDPQGRVPGFGGLGASIEATQDGGTLRLSSQAVPLDLRPLFTEVIPVSQLGGDLSWGRTADGWRLRARHLRGLSDGIVADGWLDLEIPGDGSSPFLDLRARFRDADAAKVRRYLPAGVMSSKLVDWLERSIRSGRVTRGDAIFRGRLADYPFRGREGRFELLLRFEDLLLDYQADWPALTSAAGHLRFLNQGLTIRVDSGRIYDSAFSDGSATLPELWGAESMGIHGEAQGPFADGLRALRETPLSRRMGRVAEALEVSGESRLALDIDLPFRHDREVGVAGRLSWPGPAGIGVAGTDLQLSRLEGRLDFTQKGLEARDIGAELWGRPVKLALATEAAGSADRSVTRIRASAATPVAELARRFPSDAWGLVEGSLDWSLMVGLSNRDVSQRQAPLDFELSSPLRGLAIRMPAPIGKPAKAERPLRVRGRLVPRSALSLDGHLGDLAGGLRMDLGAGGPRLTGGRLRLGATEAPEPTAPGVLLDGEVAELDLADWMAWLDDTYPGGRADRSRAPVLKRIDLDVARLRLGAAELTDVGLEVLSKPSAWQIAVRSNELAGQVYLPPAGDDRPLGVNLERLDLKALAGGDLESPSGPRSAAAPSLLASLPSLDVRATELRWGGTLLGSLDLALRKEPSGLRLPHLKVAGPGLIQLDGQGGWDTTAAGGRSRIQLSVKTQELGRLLASEDGKSVVEAQDASARVELAWPGGLTDFALPRADGSIAVDVGQGRLLEVEPGVGRVLGFLNLGALGRRLALDFTDLYGQGFAFESVAGSFTIGGGRARLDDFLIDGTSGKVTVSGSTDLTTEQLDQVVSVEPNLGSSVALASAVAGGPVVGAAVYLVDQVTGNPINRLARYQYKVTGPWRDPQMTRMGWDPLAERLPGQDGGAEAAKQRETNHFLDLD